MIGAWDAILAWARAQSATITIKAATQYVHFRVGKVGFVVSEDDLFSQESEGALGALLDRLFKAAREVMMAGGVAQEEPGEGTGRDASNSIDEGEEEST